MVLILSASLMSFPVFSAQVNNVDVLTERICKAFQTSSERYIKNEYEYSPQVFEEIKRNGEFLLTNKVFVRYLLEQYDQVGLLDKSKSPEEFLPIISNFSTDLIQKLFQLGIRRLEINDQRAFFRYRKIWLDSLDIRDCDSMLDGSASKAVQRKVAINQFEKLTNDELKDYFRIFRKAVFAEINDFPVVPSLTQEQKKYVEMALSSAMQKELKALKPDERQVMVNSLMSKIQANRPSCELIRLTYSSALSLSGPTSVWVFIALSLDM